MFSMMPNIKDVRTQLPRANDLYRSKRALGQIKLIVVHYDDQLRPERYNSLVRLQEQARHHINKTWGYSTKGDPIKGFGLMYHVSIDNIGNAYWCQPLDLITWQANGANPWALGVKVDLGEKQEPTKEQLEGLHRVLDWLCYHCPEFPAGRADVWGHSELTPSRLRSLGFSGPGNATNCPGKLLGWVQKYRKGEW